MAISDTHDSSDNSKSAKHTFEFGAKMFRILEGKSIEIFPPFSVIGLILMMSLMMSFNLPIIILSQKNWFFSLFPSNYVKLSNLPLRCFVITYFFKCNIESSQSKIYETIMNNFRPKIKKKTFKKKNTFVIIKMINIS